MREKLSHDINVEANMEDLFASHVPICFSFFQPRSYSLKLRKLARLLDVRVSKNYSKNVEAGMRRGQRLRRHCYKPRGSVHIQECVAFCARYSEQG